MHQFPRGKLFKKKIEKEQNKNYEKKLMSCTYQVL